MATIPGSTKDDVLATGVGADLVTALSGNDVVLIADPLHHAAGEKLDGGTGYDRLWINGGGTLVLLAGVTGFEAVQMLDAAGTASSGVALVLNASAVTTGLLITGGEADDTITGTGKDDVLVGGLGEDSLVGGLGNDRVIMDITGSGTDVVNAGLQTEGNTLILVGVADEVVILDLTAADQLVAFDVTADSPVQSGFSHVDASGVADFGVIITGSAGKNILIGSAKDDVFIVASSLHYISTDAISGGAGKDDALRFSSTTAGQLLTLNAALVGVERAEIADATGDESGTVTLSLNASKVLQKMLLSGNDGANTITGTAFDDTLLGNGGADSLVGGKGNDIYLYDDASDGVIGDKITEATSGTNAGKGDFIGFSDTTPGATLTLGSSISGIEGVYAVGLDSSGTKFDLDETVDRNIDGSGVLPGTAQPGLHYIGNAGNNELKGGKGHDTFTGGKGADTIFGGGGKDVVIMDIDPVSIDVIDAGDALDGNTLKLTGKQDNGLAKIDLGVGPDLDQVLELDGGAEGTKQSDFTHVDASELTGKFGVVITGSTLVNTLIGSPQDDAFIIVAGDKSIDAIQGGAGKDAVRFTSAVAGQTFTVGANIVTVEEIELSDAAGDNSGAVTLSINAASAKSAFILTGNDGLNTLTGSAHDDTLNGNGGIDVLVGGAGSDEYLYDSAADFVAGERITEVLSASGVDSVRFASTVAGETLTLTAQVVGIEAIYLDEPVEDTIVGASIHVNASALLNKGVSIYGNDGNNSMTGTKFDDFFQGGKGADSIVGGLGRDTIEIDVLTPDSADAGAQTEGNLLRLSGDGAVGVDIHLDRALGADQSDNMPGIQTGFAHVDASALLEGAISVIGSKNGDSLTGGAKADFFMPGLGTDTIQGGAGDDVIVIHSQLELGADVYNDSGSTTGDYIYFDSSKNGDTLVIRSDNVFGFDIAAAGLDPSTTTNLNITAAGVTKPFGLAGNAGRNVLTSTSHGETIFDWGGADTMVGGAGDDDYVIINTWVPGVLSIGDKISDSAGFDDMYNATGDPTFSSSAAQVIVVTTAMISGIDRFVVSGANLAEEGIYRRIIDVDNNAGFDLSAWNKGTHLAGSFGDNLLIATKYNDTIIGHKGMDTISGGAGTDLITMEVGIGDIDDIHAGLYGEQNQLILKGEAPDVLHFNLGVAEGQDQLLAIGASADSVLIQRGFVHVDASGMTEFGVDIIGSAHVNKLTGTAKDDTLDGRGGADTIVAGAGDDAVVVNDVGNYIGADRFDLGEGRDSLRFSSIIANQTLSVLKERLDNVEVVMISDADGDNTGLTVLHVTASSYDAKLELIGNGAGNSITGTSFDDTITGSDGADTLRGGSGNDVYVALTPGEVVTGVFSDAIDDTKGTADIFRFSSEIDGEVVVLTNLMTGLEIAELADDKGDATGTKNTGIDASAMDSKLTTFTFTIRGNDGDNTLTGTKFGDRLFGNKGHDSILGGLGADTITMLMVAADRDEVDGGDIADLGGNMLVLEGDAGGASVWDLSQAANQLLTVGGGAPGVVVADMTHIDASGLTGAVSITGSAEANTLIGTSDNDTFVVLLGADYALGERIDGGEGTTDTIEFASATDTDLLVLTNVTGVEEVELSHASAAVGVNAAAVSNGLKITGNTGINSLTGTAFADTIAGGDGADVIAGGGGADKITMEMDGASIDAINAGAGNEGDNLLLTGIAAGAVVVNLSLAGDQLTSINAVAEGLVQSGFQHFDARAMTGGAVSVTGSAGNNSIAGTALADVITGGLGADTISMSVSGGVSDDIDAGALTEGNLFVLIGAADGIVEIDLSAAGDQLISLDGSADAAVQSGFVHLDASAMGGPGALELTGSAADNIITGSAQVDTIDGGAGADRIVWDASTPGDEVNGGGAADGDTLVFKGAAAGAIVIDLAVEPGQDIIAADGQVQANFQHLDASALGSSGINARGNGLNNVFHGSDQGDTMTGLAGSDTFWLGGGDGVDASSDQVRYESPQDGINSLGSAFSFDRIREFKSGSDKAVFTGAFNGGTNDLDDINDANTFQFATDAKANFSFDHEAMLITAAASKLKTEVSLTNLATVAGAINKKPMGVIAATGDDGLIVVQAKTSAGLEFTGVYYYQELDGKLNNVVAGELTLLGVYDAALTSGDLALL